VQGVFVDDGEVSRLVEFWRDPGQSRPPVIESETDDEGVDDEAVVDEENGDEEVDDSGTE
jgi:DNA segregation ATPase FtsK/SpoIIIE-like protein